MENRASVTKEAKDMISQAIEDAVSVYDITYGELISILSYEIYEWGSTMVENERNIDFESNDGNSKGTDLEDDSEEGIDLEEEDE